MFAQKDFGYLADTKIYEKVKHIFIQISGVRGSVENYTKYE